ncbi:sensor histidine kinase [Herbiconiux liangxiaofengii]|uniref:sensor histidine kinase n=1 Tax=Herbiconiux liangxiaofengii TaxID=3342795 RepID=UPI0035BB53C7
MAHTPLTPVFVGLRTGLHVLFVGLAGLAIVRGALAPGGSGGVVVGLGVLLLVTYAAGGMLARRGAAPTQREAAVPGRPSAAPARRSGTARLRSLLWLGAITLEWMALVWLTPEAAYLVFPLFFLYLHLLGRWWGPAAIVASTAVAIVALGLHGGWSVGGVVGPLVGAGVALLIGLGYQALAREAEQREALMQTLLLTQSRLAATEHESGVLAERARLAREIHDTLAQGLSSIQMLLHAAERADPERPGVEHIRLARETAAANLADARRFIRELTPPDLDDRGLGGALRQLAAEQWAAQNLRVEVRVSDTLDLPMPVQTALLRIAQGAIANVIQHADASGATITLTTDPAGLRFTVADDGRGFDPREASGPRSTSDSFGLRATRERVDQLGGTLTVESSPGHGTSLVVDLAAERVS